MKFWNEVLNLLRLPNRRKSQNRFETLVVDVDIDSLVYSLIENPDLMGMYAPKSNKKVKKEVVPSPAKNSFDLYTTFSNEAADVLLDTLQESLKETPIPPFKLLYSANGGEAAELTDVLKFLYGWQDYFTAKEDFKRAETCSSLIKRITSNQIDSFLDSLNEKKTGD